MIRRPPRSTRTDTRWPDTTLVRSGEARLKAFARLSAQLVGVRPAFLRSEVRQKRLSAFRHEAATLSDGGGILHRLRKIGEQHPHFVGAAEMVALGGDGADILAGHGDRPLALDGPQDLPGIDRKSVVMGKSGSVRLNLGG